MSDTEALLEAMRDADDAITRLLALTGAASVAVQRSLPWEDRAPWDEEGRSLLSLRTAHVQRVVNECQRVMDVHEWQGSSAAVVVAMHRCEPCACSRCMSRAQRRRHAEQATAPATHQPPKEDRR